jgi:hypothetical protein
MNSISLVCTVHEEMGLANSSELLAILERIQPEVIFLEVPPAAFDDYYGNCSRRNLESLAVRQYREGRQVELVPVDLPTPPAEFFSNLEELRRRIGKISPEYRRLMKLDDASIREHGFGYLNSEDCGELWVRVYEDIVSSIKWMNNDSRLLELYESWRESDDLREKEMIENIYKYCRENTFDKGVFLVGAAHRRPIIHIAREQTRVDPTRIQWDFDD